MAALARLLLTFVAALTLAASAPPAGIGAGERVPARVAAVDVRSSRGASRHVTDPVKVVKLVRWFDALPRLRPGDLRYCPMIRLGGPIVSFAFRHPSGHVVARGKVVDAFRGLSGPCNPIVFRIRGHRETLLLGGRFLLRVQRLLDVRFG